MTTQVTQYNVFQQLTSARVVDTSNLAGSYSNGPLNNGVGATLSGLTVGKLTIDSVDLSANDRVLLVGQSNANENGVYIVTNAGGTAAIWVLTRAGDQQSIEQMKAGQFLTINAGTSNAGALYVLIEPLPAHLGIDDLFFSPSSVPSGSTFLVAANNLSDVANASTSRTNLGLGTASVHPIAFFLQSASNLSDVASAATALTNLGGQTKANIKAGISADIGGAGAGPLTVAVTGLTSSSVVVATVQSSSNPASVIACVAGAGSFDITLSADPGVACLVNYVAFIAAQ